MVFKILPIDKSQREITGKNGKTTTHRVVIIVDVPSARVELHHLNVEQPLLLLGGHETAVRIGVRVLSALILPLRSALLSAL